VLMLMDKIERLSDDMVEDYKLPGLCYMNKKTLKDLAAEMKLQERITAPSSMPDGPVDTMKFGDAKVPHILFFLQDESLADGEIIIKDVTNEYGNPDDIKKYKELIEEKYGIRNE
jgi:hypothetical protein